MTTSPAPSRVLPPAAVAGLVVATTVLSVLGAAAGHSLAAEPATPVPAPALEVSTVCGVVDPTTGQRFTYVVRWAVHDDGHAEALDERPALDVAPSAVWACGPDVRRVLRLTH